MTERANGSQALLDVTSPPELLTIRRRVAARVVGRSHQLDLILAAVGSGRDLLLEGPPGTSKSTLLHAITSEWGIRLTFVEGNADLTPAKLVGHHNPARVLREGYSEDNFVDGPLLEAMRHGGILYIEELNRAPDDTLNTLLTAMAERSITVPRMGRAVALPTFRVVATMNPFDNVGTSRLSSSVHDRLCRLAIGYQDEEAEKEIVALRVADRAMLDSGLLGDVMCDAVALTRATREHPDIRQGSSVRGAIDLTFIAGRLANLRGIDASHADERMSIDHAARVAYAEMIFDASVVALSGRIHVDDAADTTPEEILRQLWEDHFVLISAPAQPG